MDLSSLLSKSSLCRGLDEAELAAVTQIASFKHLAKGEILFLEGDPAFGFFILLEGRVRIYKSSSDGKQYTLHSIAPGQMFAEVAIFRGDVFPANCVATENASVAFLPKDSFKQLLAQSPQISLKMIAALASFIREYNQKVEELSLKEVSARLASYLLQCAARTGKNQFALPVSKTELATSLGTISETLSRNFRKMADAGIIDLQGELVAILDVDTLQAVADGDKF
jgi:CRP/FNR family transcriptional regulator, dissimilatory nitrate respiration regulator